MRNKVFALALAASVSSVALAEETTTGFGNNAYIRFDAGYSHSTKFKHSEPAASNVKKHKLGHSGVFGGGIGFRFNENIRTDITMSYRPSYDLKFNSLDNTVQTSAKVRSLVTMANVYYDIATYGVLTPYVTVGAGHARNTLKKYRAVTTGATGVGTAKSHTTNNFAWAVGAGAHASLGNGVFADVGYRFIDIGKIKSATVHFADGPDTPYHSKKIHAHEVIASIRYEF